MRYDVAISFAGEDRSTAAKIAELLAARGHSVFYDMWEQAALLGKDLLDHLGTIYRDDARFCVLIVSRHYSSKAWTRHELRSAQERASASPTEYILPLRLDDSPVPGLLATTGFLDLRKISVAEAADLIGQKLPHRSRAIPQTDESRSGPTVGELTRRLLEEASAKRRAEAAWQLDLRGDLRALGPLLVALGDSDWTVRSNAGWALVHLGGVVRLHVMEIAENSEDSGSREMAQLVLARLRGDWLESLV